MDDTIKLNDDDKKRLSKINIHKLYANFLDDWDIIVHKEIWHLYNKNIPTEGDIIMMDKKKIIKNIVDDGIVYLIKII